MVYNEKVMEIFKNPKNMGDLRGANAVGQVGNMACGDIMKIFLKINDKEVIEDAKFKTFGCAAAIVSSSVACELIKGRTVEEALNFDNNEVIKEVGELPVHKIHCSVLAKEAIEEAIKNYRKAKEKEAKKLAKKAEQEKKEKVNAKKTQLDALKKVAEKQTRKIEDERKSRIEEDDAKKELANQQEEKENKLNSLLSKINKIKK